MNGKTQSADPLIVYELFILAITAIDLVLWTVFILSSIDSQPRSIYFVLDSVLSLFFLGDFVYCFYRAENRRRYLLRRGWMDLLGSIPMLPLLRPFRLARAIQIIWKINQCGKSNILNLFRTNVATK